MEFQDRSKIVELVTSILAITPQYEPLAYTINEAREIDGASIETEMCQAGSETIIGDPETSLLRLRIPCISISDSVGDIGRYQAVFEQISGSSQATFVLISSGKVVKP